MVKMNEIKYVINPNKLAPKIEHKTDWTTIILYATFSGLIIGLIILAYLKNTGQFTWI